MANQSASQHLRAKANAKKAQSSKRFFKTGPDEYGEGDVFLGVTLPEIRQVAKQFPDVPLVEISVLLHSQFHEERLLALVILVNRFAKADEKNRKEIFNFYLAHTHRINNWDLVDASAAQIVGRHLEARPRTLLYKFSKSNSLWERRIAIVSTFHFIRQGDFADCLRLSEIYLQDAEDLIAKACGWMLREVGKRDRATLERFLRKHRLQMPRVMLRYSIEHFPAAARKTYLNK